MSDSDKQTTAIEGIPKEVVGVTLGEGAVQLAVDASL